MANGFETTPAPASGSFVTGPRVPRLGAPADRVKEGPPVPRLGAPAGRVKEGPRRREGFAVGADGTPIFYRVHHPAEPSTRLPVAFTDGIGCDGYVWKYLEPELTRDRTVVHWHFRGHGKTPVPHDPERVAVS